MAAGDPVTTVTYATSISSTRVEVSPEPGSGDGWLAGLPLTLGFTWPPDKPLPVLSVLLDQMDVSQYAYFRPQPDNRLEVGFDLRAVQDLVCATAPGMYLSASAILASDGASFTGHVPATCASPVGDPPYAWIGEVVPEHRDRLLQLIAFMKR
jgi:hypothetical protein